MMTHLLFLAALIAACRPESTTPGAVVVDSFGVVWPGLLPKLEAYPVAQVDTGMTATPKTD